jgi:AcrR family transcriptional regulator
MDRGKQRHWAEEGYKLFAEEGLEGLQVERLARMLGLNKSGFYHYFGDLDEFCNELIRLHEEKVTLFIEDVREIKVLDPEYLDLLVHHAVVVMFQVQLVRHKNQHNFYKASEIVDQRVNPEIHTLWSEFLGDQSRSYLALRYYFIVRDTFYTRISFQNLNYPYLHAFVTEAKGVMSQMSRSESAVMSKVAR